MIKNLTKDNLRATIVFATEGHRPIEKKGDNWKLLYAQEKFLKY